MERRSFGDWRSDGGRSLLRCSRLGLRNRRLGAFYLVSRLSRRTLRRQHSCPPFDDGRDGHRRGLAGSFLRFVLRRPLSEGKPRPLGGSWFGDWGFDRLLPKCFLELVRFLGARL